MTVYSEFIPLIVPPDDRQTVRNAGAVWNKMQRCYMWPSEKKATPVKKWLPRMYRSDLLSPYITPAMVPECMWGVNLRSLLSKETWDVLRKDCYRMASWHCQVCGIGGKMHCNEQWTFHHYPRDHEKAHIGIQRLQRLACLCEACHFIKHLGFARVQNTLGQTVKHMAYVNGWTEEQANYTVDKAFNEWEIRNQYQWVLDLTVLEKRYDMIQINEQIVRKINHKYLDDIQKARQSSSYLNHLFSGH